MDLDGPRWTRWDCPGDRSVTEVERNDNLWLVQPEGQVQVKIKGEDQGESTEVEGVEGDRGVEGGGVEYGVWVDYEVR